MYDPLGILNDTKPKKVVADPLGILKKKEGGGSSGNIIPLSSTAPSPLPDVIANPFGKIQEKKSTQEDQQDFPKREVLSKVNVDENDPLGSVLNPIRREAFALEPYKATADATGAKTLFPKEKEQFTNRNAAQGLLRELHQPLIKEVFPNSATAELWVKNKGTSLDPQKNETDRIALQIANKGREVKQTVLTSPTLKEAAIKLATGKNSIDQADIPEAKMGEYIDRLVNDPDVLDAVKINPRLLQEYKEEKANLYNNFPSYGEKVVNQKIAQKMEDTRASNWFYNNPGKEKVDKIVDDMVQKGELSEQEKQIYETKTRPNLGTLHSLWSGSPIQTTDVVNSLSQGINEGVGGIESSLRDISNKATGGIFQKLGLLETDEARTARLAQEQASMPQVEVKGVRKFLSGASKFTGFATPMVLGELAGIPTLATSTLMFEGQNADKSRELFPKNAGSQTVYTVLGTTIDAYLLNLLPTKKAAQGVRSLFEKDILNTVSDLSNGKITEAAAKDLWLNKLQQYAVSVGKGNIKTANILTGLNILHNGLDAITGKRNFNLENEATEAIKNYPSLWVNSTFLSALGGRGNREEVGVSGNLIRQMADNPEVAKLQIEEMAKLHPELEKTKSESLNNLNHAVEVNKELNNRGDLSEKQKDKFMMLSLKEKIINDKNKTIPDKTLKTQSDKELAEIDIEKQRILNPDMGNKKFIEEMYDNDLLSKGSMRLLEDEKGKFSEHKVGDYLKFIAQQANGLDENWKPLGGKPPSMSEIPEGVIEVANERWKDEIQKAHGTEKIQEGELTENLHEGVPPIEEPKPKIRVTAEQMEAAQPIQEEVTPPTEPPPISEELPFGRSETTGIAHEVQQARTVDTKSLPPERGDGVSVEDAIKHGQDLLKEGKNPDEAAAEFKKDNKISFDALSLVRAKHEELVRATNKAVDDFGEDSKQAKEATDKENNWYQDVVKPMQTEWHKIGMTQQGEVDIDTGSFMGLKRAFMRETGKDLTPKQVREAKGLSEKVQKLSKEVETLKQKLTDALEKGEVGNKKTVKEKAQDIADKIRKGKLSRPDTFSAATPASLVWDSALEIMAKTVEAGGSAAQAIADGLAHIRDSEWYKGLIKEKQDEAESAFNEHFGVGGLFTRFADKKDNKFSNQDAKDIWDYAKKEYLDKGADFDKMISGVSMDLGLKPEQVRDALTTPKGTKEITDAMYKKQNERNMAIQRAKDWAKADQSKWYIKAIKGVPRFFFAAKVFGHGTVGMVTHSGINIYDPVEWKRYWPSFFKQFKFAYGKTSDYEKDMQDLQNDPQFIFWKRNGLAIDPSTRYDDYQFITKIFEKMGKVGKWLTAGDRGFNALKVYRLERAKALWNDLSNTEKADKNTPKEIAKLVNHSTGTTNLHVSEAAQTAFFAPNLELARWNKLIVDPAKAVKTFTDWENATPAEKARAKIVAKRAGRILATYIGGLVVNQSLLSLAGSNQKINFTDPTQPDWLKFKAAQKTIDLTGGMISLLGFITRMGYTALAPQKELKGKTRKDAVANSTWNYVSGKFSPFAGTVKDFITQHDFKGNTLPFSGDKPATGKHKLTWKEYLLTQQTPIPVAEAINDVKAEMEKQGVPKATTKDVLSGIVIGAFVGGAGVHIREEPEGRPSPFTEEDKKDKTFKYFLDKGLELPNTQPQSEEIKDEATHTMKKVSELPKDVQQKYSDTHKGLLKEELQNIIDEGTIYVNEYGKVSLNRPKGEYTEKPLDKLTTEEYVQVLHLAQSKATTKTKKEMFNQDED